MNAGAAVARVLEVWWPACQIPTVCAPQDRRKGGICLCRWNPPVEACSILVPAPAQYERILVF